jgi:small conductance mechanosensitive channel
MDTEMIINSAKGMILTYGPRLVAAVLVLVVGLWVVKGISRAIKSTMKRREVDPSLQPFLTGLIGSLLKVMLIISVLGMLGIEMTSFIAVLGAAGLAVGMALSGTLQNFAGGVMILLFKPFKVGDFIEAQGYTGTVHIIQIFNTILKTPDNKTIIIPNGGLSTSSMVNYSTEETRRVDLLFGIGYGDNTSDAKALLLKMIEADSRILKDPSPFVAVSELADSSVNFVVRVWVNSADYWGVYFDMHEKVYNEFNNAGLNIPFPQMDVHVHNN